MPPEQGSTLLSANTREHSLWGRNCGKTELMHISFCSENITEVLTRINSRGRQIVQKIWKPTQNSRCQNAVTKDIPYWGSTNNRHHYKNLVACVTWYPKIEHPWLLAIPLFRTGTWFGLCMTVIRRSIRHILMHHVTQVNLDNFLHRLRCFCLIATVLRSQ